MLKNKINNDNYYVISTRCDLDEKTIITTVCETNAENSFNFIASFEANLELDDLSLTKKVASYTFQADELALLTNSIAECSSRTINSILKENMLSINDIDIIASKSTRLGKHLKIDISKDLFKTFNTPVICDLSLDCAELLKLINNDEKGLIVNIDNSFDIYKKQDDEITLVRSSIGFEILESLAVFYNTKNEHISHLIAQGELNEGVINKIKEHDLAEISQKDLLNIIIYANISKEDKFKTAFYIISQSLLDCLALNKNSNNVLITGKTFMLLDLIEQIKKVFDKVTELPLAEQRQNTLVNETMALFAAKKYIALDNNNGVKLS